MPLYEFNCPNCNKDFEGLLSFKEEGRCPDCNTISVRKMSPFSFKNLNPFTQDGEGFTSKRYRKQEYKERVKSNANKYD